MTARWTQAEQYARALPAAEGRPPFLVVVDAGNVVELYAEFSRTGATYTPFPDPRSHRIRLGDLRDASLGERLRQVWDDPVALDPSRRTARVTREIAQRLAVVAKSLEADGHSPENVAGFLTRCLFSMFAEDVGLLPKRAFVGLLQSLKDNPQQFIPLVGELWRSMDAGGFSVSVRADLPRFNGKLFKDSTVLPLTGAQIDLLLDAARADWRNVEPAIFGTLLERALDPAERHALGAHYTPRAYVERLVLPTVVEPLRDDWKNAQTAALLLAAEGKQDDAQAAVRSFLHQLCQVRVLDPACGSGNFLYVTLEHLKRLEGEVLNQLEELGDTQGRLETEGMSVDPHQLLGIELNPRAAAVAETVLWIRARAEEIDSHRKRQQAQHPGLTLTGMYNVLEGLKSGESLNRKDQIIHTDGLVSVLQSLHDELDLAVLDAYGWNDLAPLMQVVNGNKPAGTQGIAATRDECKRALDEALLERLVALNAERAAEEVRGLVRWLRPEFQHPTATIAAPAPAQGKLGVDVETPAVGVAPGAVTRQPWPKDLTAQIRAVAQVLAAARAPLPQAAIEARFTGRGPWKKRLPQLLDTLVAVGRARPTDAGYVTTP